MNINNDKQNSVVDGFDETYPSRTTGTNNILTVKNRKLQLCQFYTSSTNCVSVLKIFLRATNSISGFKYYRVPPVLIRSASLQLFALKREQVGPLNVNRKQ